jgi:hypothetical protein
MVDFDEEKQIERLNEIKKTEEEDVVKILADRYGYNYADLGPTPINSDALKILNEEESRQSGIVIFNKVNKKIQAAILSPNNEKTISVLERLKNEGYIPSVFMASKKSLEKACEIQRSFPLLRKPSWCF